MSRYLSRLKRLLAEEGAWEELTKLTEGAFVGFVSDQGSPLCEDEAAIEERVGLAADRVPPLYLNAWARLNHGKPARASDDEWRLAVDDGGRFLDAWGSEAIELRWTAGELFDALAGLVWRLGGACIEALGPDHARLSDGGIVRRFETRGGG
jgi:hypothetical protein